MGNSNSLNSFRPDKELNTSENILKCYPDKIFTEYELDNMIRQTNYVLLLLRLYFFRDEDKEQRKYIIPGSIINISKLLEDEMKGVEELVFMILKTPDSIYANKFNIYKDANGTIYGTILR